MADENHIPDLHEKLEETAPEPERRVTPEEEPPPPPKDWVSSPVVKTIGALVVLALVIVGIWRGPELWTGIKENPLGAIVTLFVILVIVVIVLLAYWRSRTAGRRDDRYWKTD